MAGAIGADAAALTQQPNVASQPHHNFLERNSLRIAGIANLIGDIGFLANGYKTNNPYKISGGALYTLGGLNLSYYGKVDKEQTFHDVTRRTAQFIEQHSGDLPNYCELVTIANDHQKGIISQVDQALRRQPAKNTLALYTSGAAAMLGSGIHKYRHGEGMSGLSYGISSLGVKLASLLIPEENQNEPQQGKKKGVMAWIQEKPLRIFGYGSLASEAFLAFESYQEHKRSPGESSYLWTALSSGTYMLADVMMAISHKDPSNADGRFTSEEKQRITALVAEAIGNKPAKRQAELTEHVSAFLAQQPEIGGDRHDIEASIKQQLKEKQPSWAKRMATPTTSPMTGLA